MVVGCFGLATIETKANKPDLARFDSGAIALARTAALGFVPSSREPVLDVYLAPLG